MTASSWWPGMTFFGERLPLGCPLAQMAVLADSTVRQSVKLCLPFSGSLSAGHTHKLSPREYTSRCAYLATRHGRTTVCIDKGIVTRGLHETRQDLETGQQQDPR